MKQTEMLAVLNALVEPVLVVDGKRKIVLANAAARGLFGKDLPGRDLVYAIRHPDALQCVETALAETGHAEAVISMRERARCTYRIRAARIDGIEDAGERVIVSLNDITHLIEAEQMRSDFVANVSHELRSPLTALTGGIETLQGAAKDDGQARGRFLAIMQREAARMDRLVGDLLSLSQVEANEHVPPGGRVDVVTVLGRVVTAVKTGAGADGKRLRYDKPDSEWVVPGDEDELTEVFQNLVENALKYSRAKSPVEISISRRDRIRGMEGPAIAVVVKDRGEGIAAEHIARLTERFYRVDKSRSQARGGTGLGLAIVKHILNRHRGRLQIESEPGVGSTFTVYLLVGDTVHNPVVS